MSFSWRKSVVQKSWYFLKTICENVLQKIITHYFCLDTYKHNSLKVLLINDFLFLWCSCANLSAFQSHRVRWIARKREKEREREDNCHFVNRDCRFYDFMGYICSKSFACNSQLQHCYYWPNGYTAAILSLALCTCLVLWSPCWLFSCHHFVDHHQMIYFLISCTAVHFSLGHLNHFLCPVYPITPHTFHSSFTIALAHIFLPHINPCKLQLYWCCHHYCPRKADNLGIQWFTTGKDHKKICRHKVMMRLYQSPWSDVVTARLQSKLWW